MEEAAAAREEVLGLLDKVVLIDVETKLNLLENIWTGDSCPSDIVGACKEAFDELKKDVDEYKSLAAVTVQKYKAWVFGLGADCNHFKPSCTERP